MSTTIGRRKVEDAIVRGPSRDELISSLLDHTWGSKGPTAPFTLESGETINLAILKVAAVGTGEDFKVLGFDHNPGPIDGRWGVENRVKVSYNLRTGTGVLTRRVWGRKP
jgi:hypothetical protein